jgi:signal transduction histidine kinase
MPEMIPSNQTKLRFEVTDVFELVRQELRHLQPCIEEKGLTVSVRNSLDQPTAEVDSFELGRAIRNIVRNVIHFSVDDGGITITIRNADDGSLLILIENIGSGVETDRRLGSTFDPSSYDTLGLEYAANIIALHDGEFDVKSEVGVGSEFTIRIPARPAAP